MAGEDELVPVTRKHAEAGIAEIVITIRVDEIEHGGIERNRCPHAPAAK
jgi:hypothetical protein